MGGICFFLNTNMLGGADESKEGTTRFMFRVGKGNEAEALERPGASIMEQSGRRMGGMVFVEEKTCNKKQLQSWLVITLSFVKTLPPK